MKLSLTHTIPADRVRVFDALVNPAILQRCIPGCESLVPVGADEYEATLKIGVAAFTGSYTGKARITNANRPEALTLGFEGKGGPGFVRGSAAIALTADGGATRIASDADVQVGGLIAAVGSRLIDVTARKLASDFFDKLSQEVQQA